VRKYFVILNREKRWHCNEESHGEAGEHVRKCKLGILGGWGTEYDGACQA
jgi:hypothetical protein